MPRKRRSHRIETLERRQLLAAGIESCVPLQSSVAEEVSGPLPIVAPPVAPLIIVDYVDGVERLDQGMIIDPIRLIPNFDRFDFLQQHGDRIFAVDQDYYTGGTATLFVFEPEADGTLGVIAQVPVDFRVERMIVDGDRVLLLGPAPFCYYMLPGEPIVAPEWPDVRTIAATVNLGDEVEVIVQEFTESYGDVQYDEGRLTFVTPNYNDYVPLVFPPPPVSYQVTLFRWNADGLQPSGSVATRGLDWSFLRGESLYGASSNPTYMPFSSVIDVPGSGYQAEVTRFTISNDGIAKDVTLELGAGIVSEFSVSDDGLTGTAVRVEQKDGGFIAHVDLLDFSGDGITLFSSIRLEGINGDALLLDSDYLVMNDYLNDQLLIVEVDQNVNVVARDRVRRIDLSDSSRAIRMGNRLVVSVAPHYSSVGDPVPVEDPTRPADALPLYEVSQPGIQPASLVSIALSSGEILGSTPIDGGNYVSQLLLIDAAEGRFGYEQSNPAAFQIGRSFVFGRLNGDGIFRSENSLELVGGESIDITPERLLVQTTDQLIRRDWSDFDSPVITPLGEPDPVTTAVDDAYTLPTTGEDHLLDVLANDILVERFGRAQVVELADAPVGTRIVDGRLIKIPAGALEGVDKLTFRYAVSSGGTLSTATVRVDVIAITQEQISALVDSVVDQAAEDLDVPADDIQVNLVEPDYTAAPPFVNVTVVTNDKIAEYTVTLDGQIEQVTAAERDILVDLGLRAVDADGNPIDEIREGDDFWLELTAKDLRENGDGVYAAYFDLLVPEAQLTVVGGVIFADDFGPAGPYEINGNRVNELGAISSVVLHPGNAPQSLVRIHVRAEAAGTVTLRPDAADDLGHETLLRGVDLETPLSSVRYLPLELTILPAQVFDPLDTDADGVVSAVDALRVINFLGRFGTTSLDDLRTRVVDSGIGEPESGSVLDATLAGMRRLDANGSGVITALDALVIINRLSRVPSPAESEAHQSLFDDELKLSVVDRSAIETH